ncbi:hypothetical protein [Duganella callida]|uniref:Uncharacterized protein n=1 Tax=Duganella callida TaxID=2561932 RepID=A0A4Y9SK10_9BURK|nr:hypothetical protein [Duganella callida]TFW27002.1 hypothetical protein E4L98_08065 [Duganella callida]
MFNYERPYQAYVILGDAASEPLWEWHRWQSFAAELDPVFAACRDKPLVRCGQFEIATRKEIKFGRLGWTPESAAKWTHSSPLTTESSKDWGFLFVEAAAPSLPACARDGSPPDFFVAVSNEAYITRQAPVQFSPRILMAVAKDLSPSTLRKVDEVVRSVAAMVDARLTATIERPWGFKLGSGFTAAIQDIAHAGLFKVGQPHDRPLDLNTFVESWKPL